MMERLSQEYGWLPSQIRAERIEDIQAYVEILGLKNQIEKINQKKNGR